MISLSNGNYWSSQITVHYRNYARYELLHTGRELRLREWRSGPPLSSERSLQLQLDRMWMRRLSEMPCMITYLAVAKDELAQNRGQNVR